MKLTLEQKTSIIEKAEDRLYMRESMNLCDANMFSCLRIEIALERGTYAEPKMKLSSRELLSELNNHESFNMKKYYENKQ